MEKLEDILKYWNEDSEIDRTEPGRELIKIPKLHNKYLTILTKHRIASKKAHFDYLRMRKIKTDYYSGRLDEDDLEKYGWEPFAFVLKSDINTYLEADNDLIKLMEKKKTTLKSFYKDNVKKVSQELKKIEIDIKQISEMIKDGVKKKLWSFKKKG